MIIVKKSFYFQIFAYKVPSVKSVSQVLANICKCPSSSQTINCSVVARSWLRSDGSGTVSLENVISGLLVG